MHRNKASFGSEDGVCPSRSNRLFGSKSRAFIIRKPGFPPYTPASRADEQKRHKKREKLSTSPFYRILI